MIAIISNIFQEMKVKSKNTHKLFRKEGFFVNVSKTVATVLEIRALSLANASVKASDEYK